MRLLHEKGSEGLGWWEIMEREHIGQYNRAIKQLREGDWYLENGEKGYRVGITSLKKEGEKNPKFYLNEYLPRPEIKFDINNFSQMTLI